MTRQFLVTSGPHGRFFEKTKENVNLGRVVDLRYHEAHRTMMKLHNIVILTTFNADMFQGYQILFIKAWGDDIIIHKPTKLCK